MSQLESLKLPQWAVYVALHLPECPQHAGLRRQVVRELLFRWAAELHAALQLHSSSGAGAECRFHVYEVLSLGHQQCLAVAQPLGHSAGYHVVGLATCCSLARWREIAAALTLESVALAAMPGTGLICTKAAA